MSSVYIMSASIDFTSDHCAVAFSFKTDKKSVRIDKTLAKHHALSSYYAPISVLHDARGRLVAFGFDAEERFDGMEDTEKTQFEMYRKFLGATLKQQEIREKTLIESENANLSEAGILFTQAIKYIKDHLFETIEKQISSKMDSGLVRWTISVPDMWDEASREFLFQVANKSGLTDGSEAGNVLICKESEAFLAYCTQLSISDLDVDSKKAYEFLEFHRSTGENIDLDMLHTAGAVLYIINAGETATTITTYKIGENNSKECTGRVCFAIGMKNLSDLFVLHMNTLLGADVIKEYKKQPSNLIKEYERCMRNYVSTRKSLNIPVSWDLNERTKTITGSDVPNLIARMSSKVPGIKFSNGFIKCSENVIRSLFDPVVLKLVLHIRNEVLRSYSTSHQGLIYLSGKFSQWEYFREKMREEFQHKIPVIMTHNGALAALIGGVHLGHDH